MTETAQTSYIDNPFVYLRSGEEAFPHTIEVAWETKIDEEQYARVVEFFGQTMRGLHCLVNRTTTEETTLFELKGSKIAVGADTDFITEVLYQIYDQTARNEQAARVHSGNCKSLIRQSLQD